jgi:hypothetical protein
MVAKDVLKEISKLKGHYVERSQVQVNGQVEVIKLIEVKRDEE